MNDFNPEAPAKKLPNGVLLLSLVSLLTDIASEAVYPLLPMYLMTVLGAPAYSLGIIEGVANTTASLLKLGSGIWADRLGKNKLLVFAGYMISNLTRPMLAITTNWGQVLVLRWSDRVGKGIRGAPRDAWLARMSSKEALNFVYGFHQGMDNAGALIGPLLASAFLLTWPGEYRWLFLWTIVPGTLSIFIVMFTREYGKKVKAQKEWSLSLWWSLPRQFKVYLTILFIFTLGNSTDAFLLLRLQQSGIAVGYLPLLWSAHHLVKMTSSFASGPIADRIGSRRTILLGWLIYVGVYAAFAYVSSATGLIVVFFAYGLFYGLTEGPEKAIVAKLVPAHSRGAAFGFMAFVMGIAALPASLLFGAILTWIGMPAAFLVGAGFAVAALFLLWLYFDEPS